MNSIAMTHLHVAMALCSLSDEGLVLKILITGFEPFGGETLNLETARTLLAELDK